MPQSCVACRRSSALYAIIERPPIGFFFAFNGLLVGLALGMTYQVDAPFFLMLFLAAFLCVLMASCLRNAYDAHFHVPVLSLPFVLTSWVALAAGRCLDGLTYTLKPFEVETLSQIFPGGLENFFNSLGAALFQVNTVSGLIVAAAILIFSRHAFLLAIIGYLAGCGVVSALGINPSGLAGFNFALAAMAVGGVFVLPGLDSLFLAGLAGALAALIFSASGLILEPFGLEPLAFPFVATTTGILYALKNRPQAVRFRLLVFPEGSPEKNFKKHKNAAARFVTGQTPAFEMPVSGQWTVTQGFFGAHTHKGPWAHAWDFEIQDKDKLPYKGAGTVVEDFFCYGQPVCAPGDGKVVAVVNHVEDNPVGHVNTRENWGNTVVIWHYGSVYTALCHLKPGSIIVGQGAFVHQGQKLGLVGSSGRSPRPHLHYQVQSGPAIGAPTVCSDLLHFTEQTDQVTRYHTKAQPAKGMRIAPLIPDPLVFDCAGVPVGRKISYRINMFGEKKTETWISGIDSLGTRSLVCQENKARLSFFLNKSVLLFTDYKGPKGTGLYWLFLAASRMPLASGKASWTDPLPAELLLKPAARLVFDLMEPVASLAELESSTLMEASDGVCQLNTRLGFSGLFTRKWKDDFTAHAVFEKELGLSRLEVRHNGRIVVSADIHSIEQTL